MVLSRLRCLSIVLGLLTLVTMLAAPATAAPKLKETNFTGRLVGGGGGPGGSVTVSILMAGDNNPTQMILAGKDLDNPLGPPQATLAGAVKSAKPGELMSGKYADISGNRYVTALGPYKMVAGEDEPGVFVITKKEEPKHAGQPIKLEARKMGQNFTLVIATVRDAQNNPVAPPQMAEVVNGIGGKGGSTVIVDATPQGGNLIVRAIARYVAPEKGEFVGLSDVEIVGKKRQQVEIKQTKSTVKALVSGKPGAGKVFVNDPQLMAALKQLKPGQAVLFRTTLDNSLTLLTDIRAADAK